jgi:glycosyltransferase involved in cell wall biosynthesis
MKRVLVLAYYFPPLGGAGVQRTVKFVKHLRQLGYEATVVTGPESASVSWAPPDPTLADELPPETRVLRIEKPPPALAGPRSRVSRWLQRQTPFDDWWQEGARSLGETVSRDVDVVYASMSPFGTATAAASVARAGGKPWVADLRDPWALDDWSVYPSAFHRRLELKRMRSALSRADAIVMNTAEARLALLAAMPELVPDCVSVIPNGWDRDDFEGPPPRRDDSSFRIVYAGYSHVASPAEERRRAVREFLGGAAPGLVPSARSHRLLTRALARLGESAPELAARVELHVAGAGSARADPAEATVRVVHHGYLSHPAAISLMRSADLLFLPMHGLRPGVRCRTVTGKTYEYLAAGKPILAALPDGDARDLLSALPDVRLCRPTDIDCMAAAVREAMHQGREGGSPPLDVLERFERHRLAAELAGVFEEVLAEPTTESRSRPVVEISG